MPKMPKSRYAAITMARDEDFFLKIWHDYYAAQFGAENLFVVDHNSQITSAADVVPSTCNIIRIPFDTPVADPDGSNRWFDRDRFFFISSQITALLRYYDCVIFNDADELFIVDHPDHATLPDYLDSLPEIGLRAGMGLEMFHDINTEPVFDPTQPLFLQRRHFRYRFLFCKPWVVGEPRQILGHGARGGFHLDPNLLLIHLHHIDMDQLLRRREQRMADFADGRGGLLSRWKDDLDVARTGMADFAAQPTQPDDMPHAEILEDIFPNFQTQVFNGENYRRRSGKRLQIIEVDKFVTERQKKMLLNSRFCVPDRFQGKA